jgi:hypothetical protein
VRVPHQAYTKPFLFVSFACVSAPLQVQENALLPDTQQQAVTPFM